MRNSILVLLAILTLSCSSNDYFVVINNDQDITIEDQGLTIPRSILNKVVQGNEKQIPAILNDHEGFVPFQLEDINGDGEWDRIFFLTNLPANHTTKLSLGFIEAEQLPIFKDRTNIRFAKIDKDYKEVKSAIRETHAINTITQEVWQMEGIAWENDKIGFRNYFDQRNGMDIFGKVTSEMVLDNVGYKNMPSYHEFNPEWGVDVLKVGNSLGAGSIAFEYKDSLYRLGDNGIGSCRIFTEGPLRSIFRFEYKDWKMGDQILDVIHDISITAGKYYYNNTISYSGSDSLLNIVTGIVNKKSQMLYQTPADNKHQSFYTFDLQSEDTSLLGMGIQVSRDLISKVSTSPDSGEGIIETYCLHLHAKPEQPVSFKFYSVWEKEDAKWNSKEGFEKFLLEEERKVEKVLNVNIVRN